MLDSYILTSNLAAKGTPWAGQKASVGRTLPTPALKISSCFKTITLPKFIRFYPDKLWDHPVQEPHRTMAQSDTFKNYEI